jgi:hypothetical protein
MSDAPQNPFERFDLDPREGSRAITERLRELAEDAGEAERAAIRAAWEELTLHPLRRLRAALGAHPRHEASSLWSPDRAPFVGRRPAAREPLTLGELCPRPLVASALPAPTAHAAAEPPPLAEDPILFPPPSEKKR